MQTLREEFKIKLKEITELSSRINKNDNLKILVLSEATVLNLLLMHVIVVGSIH
ncbi:MAG: hypothetical protein ACTSO5_14850 [Candidatus Heimdallarchaeaceae archaeon]